MNQIVSKTKEQALGELDDLSDKENGSRRRPTRAKSITSECLLLSMFSTNLQPIHNRKRSWLPRRKQGALLPEEVEEEEVEVEVEEEVAVQE